MPRRIINERIVENRRGDHTGAINYIIIVIIGILCFNIGGNTLDSLLKKEEIDN
jgi:hypothetical protein